jgi:hypothetical protein
VKIALSNKVLLAMTLAGGVALAQTPDWNALGKTWWFHVQFLADDSLEGRDTGSRGFEKAADYMTEQFRAAGLEPASSKPWSCVLPMRSNVRHGSRPVFFAVSPSEFLKKPRG